MIIITSETGKEITDGELSERAFGELGIGMSVRVAPEIRTVPGQSTVLSW